MNKSKDEESLFREKINKVQLEKDYVLSQLLKRTQLFELASDETIKLKKELKQAKAYKAKVAKESERVSKENALLEKQIKKTKNNNAKLSSDLEDASKKRDFLSKQVKHLSEDYALILDQLFKVQEQFESYLEENFKFRKEISTQKKNLIHLEKKKNELQNLLDRYQQAVIASRPNIPKSSLLSNFFNRSTAQARKKEIELILESPYFDEQWYLMHNPDVTLAGMDPVEHYLLHGGQEGRASSPYFCSASYLKNYPDVGDAGINPLVHYLLHGQKEGRQSFKT